MSILKELIEQNKYVHIVFGAAENVLSTETTSLAAHRIYKQVHKDLGKKEDDLSNLTWMILAQENNMNNLLPHRDSVDSFLYFTSSQQKFNPITAKLVGVCSNHKGKEKPLDLIAINYKFDEFPIVPLIIHDKLLKDYLYEVSVRTQILD